MHGKSPGKSASCDVDSANGIKGGNDNDGHIEESSDNENGIRFV